MPSDQENLQRLVYVRAFACWYFTCHAGLVIIATYDEFWMYLTNLTYCAVMITYQIIFYAHYTNGDLNKTEWKEPSKSDIQKPPYTLYRAGTFMYELATHMTLTVALAFWLIEMPSLNLNGSVFMWGWQRWFELCLSHSIPQFVMFLEWTQSGITFDWNRFPYYFCCGFSVLISNVIIGYTVNEDD